MAFSVTDRLNFVGLVQNTVKALTIVKPDTASVGTRRSQTVLALQIAARLRLTGCSVGNSSADPRDEHCQPLWGAPRPMESFSGSASTSAGSAWPSTWRGGGASLAGMENVPSEPCGWHWRNRPLRRADDSFRLLYGLLIMGHGRRQILWFGIAAHTTADWIANQLTEACGWEQIPRYLIKDRN
ncbi:hypothetical protein [Bradyrhizobium jicamae]|uniref:hypothetical protein n=1 Tax=Bradyrhizobium jicamae TaxID=280332 RepID=UPI0012ED7571|nr:hypothetical protein [Bradyrhizobium jicamae]